MKVGEVLLNVIQDINYVNKVLDGDIEIELGEVDEKLIWMTILLLQENRWEKDFWADLLIYISADSISDRVFEYFLSNKIGLEVMAHLQLDDKKLEQLTKYEEAILTLAKDIIVKKDILWKCLLIY